MTHLERGANALLSLEGSVGKFLGRKRHFEEGHVIHVRKANTGAFASDTSSNCWGRHYLLVTPYFLEYLYL